MWQLYNQRLFEGLTADAQEHIVPEKTFRDESSGDRSATVANLSTPNKPRNGLPPRWRL